eukprot:7468135-Karenia_brevis.AAC.1
MERSDSCSWTTAMVPRGQMQFCILVQMHDHMRMFAITCISFAGTGNYVAAAGTDLLRGESDHDIWDDVV